jgi:cell division FtsZ-interacting protein ZapD
MRPTSAGVLPSGTVEFLAGETEQTISIAVQGDVDVEADEAFTVTLANASGALITTATAGGTIRNDDAAPLPALAIAATAADLAEGDGGTTPFTFTVTRSGDTAGASSVDWAVSGDVDAADFGGVLPSGTVEFLAGETEKTISIAVQGDVDVEADEAFTVTLANASGALITTATAGGTIRNDDAAPLPALAIAATAADLAEGDGGTTPFTFTVTRSGDTAGASSVDWAVSGDVDATDFGGVLPSGTVEFLAGETEQTISIAVQGDVDVEADEAFTVTLANASGALITTATAGGTIRNDDAAPLPALAIAATAADLAEGDGGTTPFTFTVTRSGDTAGASSVDWAVSGDVDATDFGGVLPSGTVEFLAGETEKTISIAVQGDVDVEADEAFTVTLANASGALITTATAGGTIRNDDAAPLPALAIAATAADLAEGDGGTTPFTFTVTRSGDTAGASSVDWAVSGDVDAADFGGVLPSGTVEFLAGETEQTISIAVQGDVDVEADEAFTVTLANASGALITTATAGGTIRNDDAAPLPALAIAATAADLAEGDGGTTPFTFTVTRSGDTAGASSVDWAVSGDVDATDFGGVLPSGTVEFLAGETEKTISIAVQGDVDVEADEAFTVTLANASGALITTATAGGTIRNDDAAPLPALAIAATAADLAEGDGGTTPFTFTVTRSGDTAGASSVDWAVSGDVDAADFGGVLPSGTVEFLAGETEQTISIAVQGDVDVEADEAFTVTLANASGALITTATAGGTIRNDDAAPLPALAIAATAADLAEGDGGDHAVHLHRHPQRGHGGGQQRRLGGERRRGCGRLRRGTAERHGRVPRRRDRADDQHRGPGRRRRRGGRGVHRHPRQRERCPDHHRHRRRHHPQRRRGAAAERRRRFRRPPLEYVRRSLGRATAGQRRSERRRLRPRRGRGRWHDRTGAVLPERAGPARDADPDGELGALGLPGRDERRGEPVGHDGLCRRHLPDHGRRPAVGRHQRDRPGRVHDRQHPLRSVGDHGASCSDVRTRRRCRGSPHGHRSRTPTISEYAAITGWVPTNRVIG